MSNILKYSVRWGLMHCYLIVDFMVKVVVTIQIPVEHAQRLYNTYTGIKRIWICPGATHSKSIVVNRKEYEKHVKEFLQAIEVI